MKTVYFILGMHRSGTSALGGVLDSMGVYFGSYLMQANENNPKGYFENIKVYDFNRKLLNENDSSWKDYTFDVNLLKEEKKQSYIERIKKIITEEFTTAQAFVKDPRLCLTFPLWRQACKELNIKIKVLLPYRNPFEIAESLKARNNLSRNNSLLLWVHYFLSAEYFSRELPRLFISFDELVNNQLEKEVNIKRFLNIKVDKEKQKNNLIDPSLKHYNLPIDSTDDSMPEFIISLISIQKNRQFNQTDHKVFDKIRRGFKEAINFFTHPTFSIKSIEYEELEKKNNELETQKTRIILLYKQQQLEIQKRNAELETYKKLNDEKTIILKEQHRKSNDIMTSKIDSQEKEIINSHQEIQELRNQIKQIKDQKQKLKQNNQTLDNRNKIIKNKLKETIIENRILIDAVEEEKKQNTNLHLKESQLFSKVSSLSTKNHQFNFQLLQYKKVIDNKQIEIVYLRDHLIEQEILIDELNRKISEIVEDLIAIKESKIWRYTQLIRMFGKK